ncbi:actin cytoskeleton and mitosis protein [Lecanora helva]
MSAPSSLRAGNSDRGRRPTRASLRARGSRHSGGGPHTNHQGSSAKATDVSEARGGRRTSALTASRGRSSSSTAIRGNSSQQHHNRPPSQNDRHSNVRRNSASPNAAFQSQVGKAAHTRNATGRNGPFEDPQLYTKRIDDSYSTLKQNRERERKQAIADGFLANPDKPTTLANAITPVGTCQDMCPKFERVERIVQLMVDGSEKILPTPESKEKVPSEDIMVKRFRRSAAGYDEQLPSDIRPPLVLQKTLDYLFDEVVGGPEPLAAVHKFVWDRTRSIRNDFSIQQVTRVEDLKIAIDCYERIARFHILSLHQLSDGGPEADLGEFDPYQEREQLNNTLLSLQYYYDDSRHKLLLPNEAEFRAYGIIFEIQDQRPDVEDRLQNLPKGILKDRRVQTALKLQAASGNRSDEQGPLRPRTQFLTAQANYGGFWNLVKSNAVSYLMACVAEVYFNLVRRIALEAIWKAYKGKRPGPTKMEDWTLDDLRKALGFDDEAQTRTFCEQHEFTIAENGNRQKFIDLGSVGGGSLTDQNPRRKQIFSKALVECKRLGRTLPAVVNGMTASQAQTQGFVENVGDTDSVSTHDNEKLFVDDYSGDEGINSRPKSASPVESNEASSDPFAPFNKEKPDLFGGLSKFPNVTFGKPSAKPTISSNPTSSTASDSSILASAPQAVSAPFHNTGSTKFSFFATKDKENAEEDKDDSSPAITNDLPRFDFAKPATTLHSTNVSNSSQKSALAQPLNSSHGDLGHVQSPFSSTKVEAHSGQSSRPTFNSTTPPQSIFDKPTNSSAPTKFSFATSPLFKLSEAEQAPKNDTPPEFHKANDATSKPFFSTKSYKPDLSSPLALDTSRSTVDQSSIARSNSPDEPISNFLGTMRNSQSSNQTPKNPSPASLSITPNAGTHIESILDTTSPETHATTHILTPHKEDSPNPIFTMSPQAPKSTVISGHAPSTQFTKVHDTQSALSSSSLPNSVFNSSPAHAPNNGSGAASTSATTLDQLADAIMLEDSGLLQQFVEHVIGPIIKSSTAQLEDEESWEEAREYRRRLLSRKYLNRWSAVAWNRNLLRKGRNRRTKFQKSVQDFALQAHHKNSGLVSQFQPPRADSDVLANDTRTSTTSIPPPSLLHRRQHSSPSDASPKLASSSIANGVKRKRDDSDYQVTGPIKGGHRRSQSQMSSIIPASAHRVSQNPLKSRMNVSQVENGSMLNDILMKQARQLAPSAKSDTTHTDYFRLKALSIDPDTSATPLAKKRVSAQSDADESHRSAGSSMKSSPRTNSATLLPNPQPMSALTSVTPRRDDSDDDALFAQIRSVREALAESEQWFQTERQSMERSSTTPQQSKTSTPHPLPNPQTPAQLRLQEIRKRLPTPSRTELKLKAMGDKALLPEGFWDRNQTGVNWQGRGKGKDYEAGLAGSPVNYAVKRQEPNGLINFATTPQMSGALTAETHRPDMGKPKMGASLEDAIEL